MCDEVSCQKESSYRILFRYGKNMNDTYFCDYHKKELDRTSMVKVEVQKLNDVGYRFVYSVNFPISSKLKAN